ncbi:hypothetical protein [Endozoicomonas sp. 4G]|uniref:hypothetical protein n=1 Tax=Endozoicomonas sp. 4G TaxID=2872754 RepID=UPI0020784C79|nr:hypothetical protein [Endozoicomonas sp. 4G]
MKALFFNDLIEMLAQTRSFKFFMDSGTELVGKGIPVLTKGRGAKCKPGKGKPSSAARSETSKKKRTVTTPVACLVLEARSFRGE